MRPIKFRAWDKRRKVFYADHQNSESFSEDLANDNYVLQQFTGLLDKNGKEIARLTINFSDSNQLSQV